MFERISVRVSICAAALCLVSGSLHAGLILNEYNAVKSGEFLDNGNSDVRFGRVDENGGDWIELVVTTDHADLRGWSMLWSDSDPSAGSMVFSNAAVWADVRSGTIITISEDHEILAEDSSSVVMGTDLSTDYVQQGGDWWMHISTRDANGDADTTYISTDNDGKFSVNNDDWEMTIMDTVGTIFGPIGEGVSGWGGGGLGKKEVGKLEADPSMFVGVGDFSDGSSSTFGLPNSWDGGKQTQNFEDLRDWAPVPAPSSFAIIALAGLATAGRRRS